MVSRFADIVSDEKFIKNSTECCFAWGISDAEERVKTLEEIPPKELNAYISEFIITVRKKDNNEDYEPSSLRYLMVSFERYLKKKNSTFLSKALINRQPLTSPETEMKSTTSYKRLKVLDSDSE